MHSNLMLLKARQSEQKLIYLLGGIIGLLLPMLWIVFASSVDDSIKDVDHLERISPRTSRVDIDTVSNSAL